MPKVSEMIQSKFLRKEDFDERGTVLTIKNVKLEDMPGNDNQQKWVLYFREIQKGLALAGITIRILEKGFGDDSDMWIGKRVKVFVDPNVSFGNKIVGGLRLKTPVAQSTLPPPPPPPPTTQVAGSDDDFSDDIPF